MKTQPVTQSWRPYTVLAVGLLTVSSSAILIRFAQDNGAPSLVISAWRVGLAWLVLTPLVLSTSGYRTELTRLDRKTLGLAVLSGAFLAAHFSSWITSLEYTSVISSVVLVTTNPIWVILAAPFFLHEHLSRVTLGAVAIAGAGVILVTVAGSAGTAPHQNAALLGNALALIGAIAVAGYYLIGRRVRSTLSVIPYIWLTYGSATIFMLIIVALMKQPVLGLKPEAYFWMTMVSLICQLIGHSAYNYALGYLSAGYVSLTILGEPIISTILAALLLNEQPAGLQLLGGALILVALMVASREEARTVRLIEQEAAAT